MKYWIIHLFALAFLLIFFIHENQNELSKHDQLIKDCKEIIQGGKFHITTNDVSISKSTKNGGLAALESQYLDNPNTGEVITLIDLGDEVSINTMNLPEIYEDKRYVYHVDVGTSNKDWMRIATGISGITNVCLSDVNGRYVRITSSIPYSKVNENNAIVNIYGYPVTDVKWIYDTRSTLVQDKVIERNLYHPRDSVLYSSGASGVQSHSIVDGWLLIDSGRTGNGRVYWDYHQLPEFQTYPEIGFNMAMTGTFKLTPEVDNLSIKDGNHNTSGWELNEQLSFGGFGLAIRRTRISSKAEYWHNFQGVGYQVNYPDGFVLEDNKEYKYFLTIITNEDTEEVVLNVWLDFGNHGWVKVLDDRTWSNEGWEPGLVPDRDDKEDILRGPSHVRRHHIWTRANNRDDERGVLPIRDVKIGFIETF